MTSKEKAMAGIPNIVVDRVFYVIVCVPLHYTSNQTIVEAIKLGLVGKWIYYEEGHERLNEASQNVTCQENKEMKHVILVARL